MAPCQFTWIGSLLHFGLQSSHLNICYYNAVMAMRTAVAHRRPLPSLTRLASAMWPTQCKLWAAASVSSSSKPNLLHAVMIDPCRTYTASDCDTIIGDMAYLGEVICSSDRWALGSIPAPLHNGCARWLAAPRFQFGRLRSHFTMKTTSIKHVSNTFQHHPKPITILYRSIRVFSVLGRERGHE